MSPPPRQLVVLDFEATCNGPTPPAPQEIIEFPSVLLDADTLEVVDVFEAFVRPLHHPELSDFCTELTGITQADVRHAPLFPEVFAAHQEWLRTHGLDADTLAFVTCGDWDLSTMLPEQLAACDPPLDFVPPAYRRWINLKRPFTQWRGTSHSGSMLKMLEALGLALEGRHHRGIDDCRNIARMTKALAEREISFDFTGRLSTSRYPTIELCLTRGAREKHVTLPKRAMASLLGVASGAFRRQAKRAFLESGEALTTDADLRELRSGARLRIE